MSGPKRSTAKTELPDMDFCARLETYQGGRFCVRVLQCR